ncbi:alpha/beta fold hydrolase [Actinomadura rugatobispora]|uniref:Alpha/beta fold hydrolase n=1 Tax=Actinomadura rugatobispora TaxID=1994 RepID=A0ABW1AJW0_9ACTN|nr:alpha/beta hydrolase [Actinomadura rugatobispora]
MRIANAAGEQVHVVESGEGPPLLLASGLGGAWFDWDPTVELLREDHRVVVYDNPGLGRSPAAQAPPSLRRNVRIMAALADEIGPPVTVLAHSMGAFTAEALARLHPELLNGLVLVDPSQERDPCARPRLAAALDPLARALGTGLNATRLARLAGPAGRRLVLRFTSDRDDTVPAETVRDVYGRGTVLGTIVAEELAYREMAADLDALRDRRPFPDLPLVVLTALGDAGPSWAEGHRRLAAMSPRGRQVELPRAKHMLQLDRPDAIADAVAAVAKP